MWQMKLTTDTKSLVTVRAAILNHDAETEVNRRTDRLFACLFVFQWLVGFLAALFVSPETWQGGQRQIHPHVWTALFLGAAIISLPIMLAWKRPGRLMTRMVVAVAQMLYGALLIHLTGGRIETHFHVFGSLAFLSFYRDWRVLVIASVVVTLDHFIRGMFWPESIYGIATGAEWRWLEHAGWVVFIDIFLCYSSWQTCKARWTTAERQAQLELTKESVEHKVLKRTADLRESEARFRALATHSPVGIFQTDAVGGCVYVNEGWTVITGMTPLEAAGQGWRRGLHPDDADRVLHAWQSARKDSQRFRGGIPIQGAERAGVLGLRDGGLPAR